jgi:hypothetical protein
MGTQQSVQRQSPRAELIVEPAPVLAAGAALDEPGRVPGTLNDPARVILPINAAVCARLCAVFVFKLF